MRNAITAPGPWTVSQKSKHYGSGQYHNLWPAIVSDGEGYIVAKVEQRATAEDDNATAHLIAAAPEMRAALEKILAAAEGSVGLKNAWVVRGVPFDAQESGWLTAGHRWPKEILGTALSTFPTVR